MEPSGERSVKPKIIVEFHNSENLGDLGLLGNHRNIHALLIPRSTLDRDCQHAPLSKDMAETRRSSFSTSSRVMSFVA